MYLSTSWKPVFIIFTKKELQFEILTAEMNFETRLNCTSKNVQI